MEDKRKKEQQLPVYADGYPDIAFPQTDNDVILKPSNKILSDFTSSGVKRNRNRLYR
jgi:hypothetical protein